LHFFAHMRMLHVLGALAVVSFGFACGDANDGTSLRRGGVPNPGDPTEHDDSTDGANDSDPGNPNANTPPPPPGGAGVTGLFGLALSTTTPASDMDANVPIDVTVTPQQGFTGAVNVTATGLPAGVTFDPVSVTVGAAPATGRLVLRVAAGAVASPPNTGYPIQIVGTSGGATASTPASFKVNPKITLRIPVNLNALRQANVGTVYRNEWGAAFGATPVPLRTQAGNGIVVTVFNADSTPHVIHGSNGFAHGDSNNPIPANSTEMLNGAIRTRTLNVGVNSNGYPHEGGNGPSVSFRMAVAAAP
jgi:hypothetical protein